MAEDKKAKKAKKATTPKSAAKKSLRKSRKRRPTNRGPKKQQPKKPREKRDCEKRHGEEIRRKKEAEPKARPKKRVRVVVRASSRYVRVAPRKARLVADQVRGLHIDKARRLLQFSPRGARTSAS